MKDSVGIVDGAVAVGKKDLVGKDVLSSLSRFLVLLLSV